MEEVLSFITRFLLGLVAVLAVIEFVRHRDRTRLDIMLMLASLGVPVLMAATGLNQIRWLQTLAGMAVVAQPYLLLRLVEDFRPVPRAVVIAGALGMVLSWVALIVSGSPRPPAITLSIIAYFVLFESYAIVVLFRGAVFTRGVSKWRYGLAAGGSALLAATLLLIGVGLAAPGQIYWLGLVRGVLPILAGVAYYLAFIPPVWLRQAWQLPEVREFLRIAAGHPARERADLLLKELCEVASRATGGLASIVFLWDDKQKRFSAASSDVPGMQSLTLDPAEAPLLAQTWNKGRSTLVRSSDELAPLSRELGPGIDASASLLVPVATPQSSWGFLIVLQRRGSLFPSDDLALLEILAEQCAIALDNAELVARQEQRAEQEHRLVSQLEAANLELEAFSYSVSHDLRAPLRGIDGFSLALQKESQGKLDAQEMHYLDRIRTNSQLMGRLIDDLLRLSRITRSPLKFQQVDLSAMVRSIAEELHSREPERKARFCIEDGVQVWGDPGLMLVAMENLLGNAWKFTSHHPSAVIEFEVNREGETPVYTVKDDGAGFEMEYVDKLFGPFQRLHAHLGFDGTGIGLATVNRIITRHGGRMWAEGAVEQGAAFHFTLE